jgi:hypothetical protein
MIMSLKSRIFALLFLPMTFSGIGLLHLVSLILPTDKLSAATIIAAGIILGILLWIVDSIAIYKMIERFRQSFD